MSANNVLKSDKHLKCISGTFIVGTLNMPASQQKEILTSDLMIEMRKGKIYPLFTCFSCRVCGILDRGYEFYLLCHYLNKQLFQKQLYIFI